MRTVIATIGSTLASIREQPDEVQNFGLPVTQVVPPVDVWVDRPTVRATGTVHLGRCSAGSSCVPWKRSIHSELSSPSSKGLILRERKKMPPGYWLRYLTQYLSPHLVARARMPYIHTNGIQGCVYSQAVAVYWCEVGIGCVTLLTQVVGPD